MIIKFTKADVLRGTLLEKGWYSWLVSNIEATPNENKDGINYKVTFRLIDKGPDYDGKEVPRTFSSKAIGMMISLVAAAKGVPVSSIPKENFELDTDDILNKKIDGNCIVDTYNGNMNNKVEEYAPYKQSSNIVPFG